MFTVYHFIWLAICIPLCAVALWQLKKRKPPLKKVLSLACIVCVLSEVIKTLSVLKMVPSTDGTTMHLYMEMQHLPLHLCSIQILFIFYARFAREGKAKETLLAFMYPSCILGAFFALMLPSIFSTSIDVTEAFTHPMAYQFFLYHTMLVVLGAYITMSGEIHFTGKHYLSSMGILGVLAFVSLYMNSIFATPTYVNGELVSVEYSTNFFFTQRTPIGVELTTKGDWFLYMGIILTLAVVLVGLFYLPFILKDRKAKKTA